MKKTDELNASLNELTEALNYRMQTSVTSANSFSKIDQLDPEIERLQREIDNIDKRIRIIESHALLEIEVNIHQGEIKGLERDLDQRQVENTEKIKKAYEQAAAKIFQAEQRQLTDFKKTLNANTERHKLQNVTDRGESLNQLDFAIDIQQLIRDTNDLVKEVNDASDPKKLLTSIEFLEANVKQNVKIAETTMSENSKFLLRASIDGTELYDPSKIKMTELVELPENVEKKLESLKKERTRLAKAVEECQNRKFAIIFDQLQIQSKMDINEIHKSLQEKFKTEFIKEMQSLEKDGTDLTVRQKTVYEKLIKNYRALSKVLAEAESYDKYLQKKYPVAYRKTDTEKLDYSKMDKVTVEYKMKAVQEIKKDILGSVDSSETLKKLRGKGSNPIMKRILTSHQDTAGMKLLNVLSLGLTALLQVTGIWKPASKRVYQALQTETAPDHTPGFGKKQRLE